MTVADPLSSAECWRLRHDVPKVAAAGTPVHYDRPVDDDPGEHRIVVAVLYGQAVPLTVPGYYLTPPATHDWTHAVTPDPPKFLSIPEVQAQLGGISRRTVYYMIDAGSLRRVKVGARAMITRESLEAYIEQQAGVTP
ncbi:helix-turn-helix DNA binding protein [Gordonia phage EMoore]|uniref:Helix-turn-helix DNA binding protein n=1 Tax=Gordonia phage EMoore TaxID=2656534 RepID=A0A649VV12_9CAUD|nr:helix-turn-helix DNA binding protein [Gordonia phage EMoore]QGJ95835.1 helix-turn-helix DNA binding protein [Gordonia phage EMoore]